MATNTKNTEPDDIVFNEENTTPTTNTNARGTIVGLDDLQKKYVKAPKVGESVEFTVQRIRKLSAEECKFTYVDANGKEKKASTALSNVDYGIVLETNEGDYAVNSWSVFGQLKACMKHAKNNTGAGMQLRVNHLLNGMLAENKDKECWQVSMLHDGKWVHVDKATQRLVAD